MLKLEGEDLVDVPTLELVDEATIELDYVATELNVEDDVAVELG